MATVTKPIALDESLHTTEQTPRNVADVLAQELARIAGRQASDVNYDSTDSGLTADNVQDAIDELASEKVDKEAGKGLSTNDYTDAEKAKLAGIEANAEVNVQSDWSQADSSADDYIKNKPTADEQTATDTFSTINGGLLSECKVTLSPIQDLSHGDPSPDNICPISGHTQVDVDVSDGQTTQEQVTVNLGGTYYSGTLDVVTGVFTPDMIEKDMGDITYNYNPTENIFGTELISDMADPIPTKVQLMCSALNALTPKDIAGIKNADDNSIAFNSVSATKFMRIKCTSYTDGNALKTAMTGQKIVYEIINPTPIQLTPQQVKALVGENHLSAPLDGQEIGEVKYKELFTFEDVMDYVDTHGGSSSVDYSTTEHIVGTWIDGKPIYEITLEFTIPSGNTYPHGVSNIKKVVSMDGIAYKSDLSEYAPLPFANMSNWSWNGTYEINATNIVLELGTAFKGYYTEMLVTFRYTKTTD